MKNTKKIKPIHKYNGGNGATLCHSCRTIINIGFSEELYCEKCKNNNKKNEKI
jgi:hypothetical protein